MRTIKTLWNFVLNSELRKFRHGISIVERAINSPQLEKGGDAHSVTNWAVVGQLS